MRPLHLLLTLPTLALAQTSTITVLPSALSWDDAAAACQQRGAQLYPVPAVPTDAVYDLLDAQPEDRYWIARRGGRTCTCLNKNYGGDRLEETLCSEVLPAFCGS